MSAVADIAAMIGLLATLVAIITYGARRHRDELR